MSEVFLPQVHIIEASAGSGKTYCLAKKYISLIIDPSLSNSISNILAITFTNKAAGEMKERILEFLKKIALDLFENEKEFFYKDKEVVKERAYRAIEEILKNYNFFQVQTIDSFINTILSGCAYRLGLSVNFKTERYFQSHLNYSLDRLIDRANSEKKILRIFQEFIRQYLILENRTGWFPKQNILKNIFELFDIYNKQTGKFIPNEVTAEELFKLKKGFLKKLEELYKILPPQTDKRFVNNFETFLNNYRENFNLSDISDFFKHENFPIRKGNLIPEDVSKLWREIRNDLEKICQIEASSFFNAYIEIFNNVLGEIQEYIQKENLLFLDSLNKEAYSLFKETTLNLPELYYRLSLRLKYFLIDEFQDTSRLQWYNLKEMVEDALARGGSLFYVGDKKQAIYRFRGGEVSLFEEVKDYFKKFPIEKEILKKNYRSRKEIVEFNNFIFSEENLRRFISEIIKNNEDFNENDISRIVEVFKDSKQQYLKEGGYVKLDFFNYQNREERDEILKEKLISLLKDIGERYSLKDIAILVRKNSEVELITNWLLENSVPVESEKTLNLKENPYIKEIISFLKFLSRPIDNLSFSSFILGDIFCKKAKIEKDVLSDFIFETNLKGGSVYLYREFRKRYPHLWNQFIDEHFKSVGFVPLYESLITIFENFSVFENFPEHQGFFMKLLETVKEYEEDYPDVFSFLEFFEKIPTEELFVTVTKTDAVKIMTIHKAKGLGFPVVIIPILEMALESPRQFIVSEKDNLRIIYLKKVYNYYSSYLAKLYKEEYLNSFIDELNTLYVAFTRAEDELYIFPSQNTGRQKNPVFLLIPQDKLEYGKKEKYPKEEEIYPTLDIPASKYKDWLEILREEFIEGDILKERDKITYGEVVHSVLSYIGNLYLKDRNNMLKEAIEKTKLKFPYFDRYDLIEKNISMLLKKKKFEKFFIVKEGSVFQELELVDFSGNTHRVDRLIVKDKEVLIVDYKTSRERIEEDIQQVKEYTLILKDIYPDKTINGFLIYLDNFSLKEVYG